MAIAALIIAMVALSIAGSAYWHPAPLSTNTLELGGATPVGLEARTSDETISAVLDLVAPTVAFLTIPEAGRSGSGVVVHEAGFVVTNAHVVEGVDETLLVTFGDGIEYEAEVYGIDSATDLAVVKVDSDTPLRAAALGDSDRLQVGEFVLALGAPFGLEATVTSGIVSGLHRSGLGLARYEDFIVTDAPINRGNSGGPLVNLRGEVVGINTAIIAGDEDSHGVGGFSGVGFAIPVNVMRVVAQRLIGDGGLAGPDGADAGSAGTSSDTGAGRADTAPGNVATDAAPRTAPVATPVAAVVPVDGQAAGAGDFRYSVALVQSFDAEGRSLGMGSGFVVSGGKGDMLLTNEHVVRGARWVRMVFTEAPSDSWGGRVLALNAALDLALVSLPRDDRLVPLRVSDGDQAAVGQAVMAVGARPVSRGTETIPNPGSITALDVRLRGLATHATIIETDASIEVGDSGGPLLNDESLVVGVMVARERNETGSGGGRHSYAVALRTDREFGELVVSAESPGFEPGFSPIYPRDGRAFVLAMAVVPDGLAAVAGLQPRDRITGIDGVPMPAEESGQVAMLIAFTRKPPGTTVVLEIQRRSEEDEETFVSLTVEIVVPGGSGVP